MYKLLLFQVKAFSLFKYAFTALAFSFLSSSMVSGQCTATLDCPPSTTVNAGANCDAVVNYNPPTVQSDCYASIGDLVITEADPNTPDVLEIQNLSSSQADYSGYIAVISNSYSDINRFNTRFWRLGTFGPGEVRYRTDGSTNSWGNNMFWNRQSPSWAMIIGPQGEVVDAVFWGWSASAIASFNATINGHNITIPSSVWSGPGISGICSGTNSRSRQGSSDNNDASDWACIPRTSGLPNPGFTAGLSGGIGGGRAPSPTQFMGLSSGASFPVGTNVVGWAWEDASLGLSDSCYFNVVVKDMSKPMKAKCPSQLYACPSTPFNYTIPTFDDNCGGKGLAGTLVTGLSAGSIFPTGTTNVEYTYTDVGGNSETCAFQVTVATPPTAQDITVSVCNGSFLGFDLQAHVIMTGNAVMSDFSWVAQANSNASGQSTTPQMGHIISDILSSNSPAPTSVVYTVTPSSKDGSCPGPDFTVTVNISGATTLQALPGDICLGGQIDLAPLVRDYGLSARRFFFYDDLQGPSIGNARAFRGTANGNDHVFVTPTSPGVHSYYVSTRPLRSSPSCGAYTTIIITVRNCNVRVAPIAKLEGAYDVSTGLMRDDLRAQHLLPSQEPYTAMGYTFVNGGGETVQPSVFNTTGNNAIVDWVIVELRDATDNRTVVASRAALLQADGNVVDLDGLSPVEFQNMNIGDFFVSVIHRNHISNLTASTISLDEQATTVDFSDPSQQVYGGNGSRCLHTQGSISTYLLFAGDADGNGEVQNTDNILDWMPSVGLQGYQNSDYDLDGQVQNTDMIHLWIPNVGKGGSMPR